MKTEEPTMWTPRLATCNNPCVNPDKDPSDWAELSQQLFDGITRILQRMEPVIEPTNSPLGVERLAVPHMLRDPARVSRTQMRGNTNDDENDSELFSSSDVDQDRRRREKSSKNE